MAGSFALLRQFESQIPSLESQMNPSLYQRSPSDLNREEEKEDEEDFQMNLSDDLDEDVILSSVRLQTNVSFELDEQDALHDQYQQHLDELR